MIHWQALRDTTGVLALLRLADGLGLARGRCLAGTGIDAAALERPFATVRAWQELAVIRNLQAMATARPEGTSRPLGLAVARHYGLMALGILGLGMAASATLEAAFRFAGAYQTFGLSFSRLRTRKEAGQLTVSLDERAVPRDCQTFCVERGLAVPLGLIRELTGGAVTPQRLELRMPGSPVAAAYRDFFGVAPTFDAPANRMVFAPGLAETALPSANRKTLAMAEHYCAEIRALQTRDIDLDRRLRGELERQGFRVTAPELAAALGISERSLRRQLAARATSLRRLVLETRMAHARDLLAGGASVEEAALAAGYGETASFSRAFKAHTGVTPKRIAQQAGG